MRRLFILSLLVAFWVACGSSSGTHSFRRSGRLLTAEEMTSSSAKTAYEAVQLLRPQWLTLKGVATARNLGAAEPVVYVDNIRFGGLAALETLYVLDIKEIRYLTAAEATTRFGIGHVGGALLVIRK